jgi:hypothetical protein
MSERGMRLKEYRFSSEEIRDVTDSTWGEIGELKTKTVWANQSE